MTARKGYYRNRRGQPTETSIVKGNVVNRLIPNPEWINSEEYREEERQKLMAIGTPVEDKFPDEYGKQIPQDGAWIMLLMNVHVGKPIDEDTEKTIHITVPRLSIWYAMPYRERHGLAQAIINTPNGSVHIWPHEYQLTDVSKWLEFSEKDGLQTHFLSASGGFHEESLFYLRSRGIAKAEAQRMLLGSLKDPNYCYFTFVEEVTECFLEGGGTTYLQPHNHERRRQSHLRRKVSK